MTARFLTRHAFACGALRGSGLKALNHELDDGRPAGKVEVGAQRADVGKELTAAGDEFTQAGKAFIEPVKQGVQQVGQHDHAGQCGAQVLLSVAEVVLEAVALGFEGVVVLVLDLPARAPGGDDLAHVVGAHGQRAGKAVAVQRLARLIGGDQLAPATWSITTFPTRFSTNLRADSRSG